MKMMNNCRCGAPRFKFSGSTQCEACYRSQKDMDLRRRYGISIRDYDRMCYDQNDHCAICQQFVSGEVLDVDHNH